MYIKISCLPVLDCYYRDDDNKRERSANVDTWKHSGSLTNKHNDFDEARIRAKIYRRSLEASPCR